MKFYFCEKCGKRLTENDIAHGQAKDKKLKGVYCQECSIGVLTMETLPITDAEARELLGKRPSPATPLAATAARHLETRHRSPSSPERAPVGNGIIFGAAAAAALLGILLFALSRGGTTSIHPPAPSRSVKPPDTRPSPGVQAPREPVSTSGPSPAIEPVPVKPTNPVPFVDTSNLREREAQEKFDRLAPFADLAEKDNAERVGRLKSFLEAYGDTIAAGRARTMLDEALKKLPETPAGTLSPTSPAAGTGPHSNPPPAEPESTKPKDKLQEARVGYASFFDRFFELLRQRNLAAAQARLANAEQDPALQPLQDELAGDRRLVDWLKALEGAVLRGAEKLKDADDFELLRLRGESLRVGQKAPFQVSEFKGDRLQVGQKGLWFSVALADLQPQTLGKLAELGLAQDGEGRLHLAFSRMLALDGGAGASPLSEVSALLDKAGQSGAEAGDVEILRLRLERAAKGARELAAGELLAKFDQAFAARKWSEAQDTGRKVLEAFPQAGCVKARANLREQISQASRNGAPIQEYELTLQTGKVLSEWGPKPFQGCEDTYVYGWRGHHDIIQNLWQQLRTGEGGNYVTLIRFSIFEKEGGPVPDQTEILDAKLYVHMVHPRGDTAVEVHRIASPWKLTEVSWNSSSRGVAWQKPGVYAYEKAETSSVSKPDTPWCDVRVTESLREMQKERKNYGWKVLGLLNGKEPFPGMLEFFSSRGEEDKRPKLHLKVRGPKITP